MRASLVLLLALVAIATAKYHEYREYPGGVDYREERYHSRYQGKYDDDSDEDSHEDHSKEYKRHSLEDDDSDEDDSKQRKQYYREKHYKKYYQDKPDSSEEIKHDSDEDDDDDDDDDSDENDSRFDDAVYFSKRKLQYFNEHEEDGFFDDVKAYYQKEKYIPNYKEYKQYMADHSKEKYYKNKYYTERHYEAEKPTEVESREGSQQVREQRDYRKYPEEVPQRRYNWKDDRVRWRELPPLQLPPPEKPYKDFVPTAETPEPPPPTEAAKMARYIVHHSDWTTVATMSTLRKIRHYPFVNVLSVSDGPVSQGSGIPYLYMTELDISARDLSVNRRCSISMSLAETDYCKQQKLDPEDPRCAHLTITGEMYKLKNGTQTAKLAEEALFSRHPEMKNWPKDHNFFFATLKMEQIMLLDYFGGPKFIDVKDYLRVPSTP